MTRVAAGADNLTPVSYADTGQLIDELVNRLGRFVIVYEKTTGPNLDQIVYGLVQRCTPSTAMGLLYYATEQVSNVLTPIPEPHIERDEDEDEDEDYDSNPSR